MVMGMLCIAAVVDDEAARFFSRSPGRSVDDDDVVDAVLDADVVWVAELSRWAMVAKETTVGWGVTAAGETAAGTAVEDIDDETAETDVWTGGVAARLW